MIFVKLANLDLQETYEQCCNLLGFKITEEKEKSNVILVDKSLLPKYANYAREHTKTLLTETFVLECIQYGKIQDESVRKMIGLDPLNQPDFKKSKTTPQNAPEKKQKTDSAISHIAAEAKESMNALVAAADGKIVNDPNEDPNLGSVARGSNCS